MIYSGQTLDNFKKQLRETIGELTQLENQLRREGVITTNLYFKKPLGNKKVMFTLTREAPGKRRKYTHIGTDVIKQKEAEQKRERGILVEKIAEKRSQIAHQLSEIEDIMETLNTQLFTAISEASEFLQNNRCINDSSDDNKFGVHVEETSN